ncbi:Wadjet anti-phage system protein JetD domain-containing protein [Stenotrophomonas nitritireducens]|uniref:Wadjet anti-phage system protein JetD domain-containing protein n=1 Tax=Stenotrophomonas nitritireducens TaxID=83617 RepID=UPI003D986D8E
MTPAAQPEDDTPARRVLERLLRRAEAASLNGGAPPVSLSMTGNRDGAEYRALSGVADFDAFHARIALAERAGAITVERDRHRDDGERLLRLTVRDLSALARDLRIELLGERVAQAGILLAQWQPPPGSCENQAESSSGFPIISEVLEAWRAGRKVRGCGPEAAAHLADAAQAVNALLAEARGERILRKASVTLFGDSKRLEKLTAWLDVLVTGELAPSGLEEEQLWAALGLRREPQPLRLAGPGTVQLDDGSSHRLPRSWLGFPVNEVRGIDTDARALLSIENLASFHEAAAMRGDAPVLLLYTGGMPSPTWRQAYARLLAGLPADAALYHWGDIDRGGFRIAAKLVETVRQSGRTLRPWLMTPEELPADIVAAAEPPSPAVLDSMCDLARRVGWDEAASALQRTPLLLEQERLHPRLPP